jgi:hypothetical protein
MRYTDDAPKVSSVTELSHRARHMVLWLRDLTNPALSAQDQEASADMLLREMPDTWTAEELVRLSRDTRLRVGPKASYHAWLSDAGWLVGEEERLPERAHQPSAHVTRTRVMPMLAKLLGQLGGRP